MPAEATRPRHARARAAVVAELVEDSGAGPVEFLLVGALLTILTLGVVQFGLAVYVRNVVHDAAVEGAYHAALADTTLAEGAERAREIIRRTIGGEYAAHVEARQSVSLGQPTVELRVEATLPLAGLLGAAGGLEVTAHAPAESFD